MLPVGLLPYREYSPKRRIARWAVSTLSLHASWEVCACYLSECLDMLPAFAHLVHAAASWEVCACWPPECLVVLLCYHFHVWLLPKKIQNVLYPYLRLEENLKFQGNVEHFIKNNRLFALVYSSSMNRNFKPIPTHTRTWKKEKIKFIWLHIRNFKQLCSS